MRKLIRHPAVQGGLARLVGLYLSLVVRTTRWQLQGAEPALALVAAGQPLILAFWHERLPLMPALVGLARAREPAAARVRPQVLVSQHRDGRFIGAAVARFDMDMIYGSSRRGGAGAITALLRALRKGQPVAITPDGPRGPRRRAAPGVGQIAAVSGAPVVPVGAATTAHRRLGSWDRMMFPLPFGRGAVVCGLPITVARDAAEAALPEIEAALTAACTEADRLCGLPDAGA
ncbi:lysophospholipid acyltransferase family protein [Falsiroseomonas tokyonensis]|uniref:Lysophospholipid acyltransferase family protein n=1 Tax=Falsiroseomonas tokyonensis TaxID=430521 RepID=A0ABV7BXF5_9PROT|nr:lysophospholipid acyltransferase family protein [Falsiroseomonas tokyonensis]